MAMQNSWFLRRTEQPAPLEPQAEGFAKDHRYLRRKSATKGASPNVHVHPVPGNCSWKGLDNSFDAPIRGNSGKAKMKNENGQILAGLR